MNDNHKASLGISSLILGIGENPSSPSVPFSPFILYSFVNIGVVPSTSKPIWNLI
jgi:hypothetical protein